MGRPRRVSPPDDAGRLPGKPEQNAVPTKGDIMAIARAGNGFPPPADKHHILYVHTAVPSKGAAGFFLFDTFLFYSQTYYKRIHDFHYGRTWDFSGALFLRLSAPALQGARAAAPVLKLFNQISRLEGI